MKTFKQFISEASATMHTDLMNPAILDQFERFIDSKINGMPQPHIVETLERLEDYMESSGYTLGDQDVSEEDEGSEDFFIYTYATGELVKDVFLSVSWEKMSNGHLKQEPAVDGEKGKLHNYSVNVEVNRVTPEEMQEIIDAQDEDELDALGVNDFDDLGESTELNEQKQVKVKTDTGTTVKAYEFDSVKKANDFMSKNKGYGLVKADDDKGKYYVAKNSDKGVKEDTMNENKEYDKLYKAVAKHMGIDPKDADNLPKDKKKKFYDTLDRCWDEDEDKVSDSCPKEIHDLLGEATKVQADLDPNDRIIVKGEKNGKSFTKKFKNLKDYNKWAEKNKDDIEVDQLSNESNNIDSELLEGELLGFNEFLTEASSKKKTPLDKLKDFDKSRVAAGKKPIFKEETLVEEDADLDESKLLKKHKDNIAKAVAELAFNNKVSDALEFLEDISFNKYLEITNMIIDGKEREAKREIEKLNKKRR